MKSGRYRPAMTSGGELREMGLFERRPWILVPTAPQKPRREIAPQRRIAEEAAPAAVESCLIRGRGRRAKTLQLERDLGRQDLDLVPEVRDVVVDGRGVGGENRDLSHSPARTNRR